MPTYQKCGKAVIDQALSLISKTKDFAPLARAHVIIDFVFAYGDVDENGVTVGDAIRYQGYKALSVTKIIGLKERAKGQGDAEILIDCDWWSEASPEQHDALLDHELTHLIVKTKGNGEPETDDLGRPKLSMRKHDVQAGWFKATAARHGEHSLEQTEAKSIADNYGQFFWPAIFSGETEARPA